MAPPASRRTEHETLASLGSHQVNVVWSKISNALKRLGFRSHNFLAQLLSETSRACTIPVRRSSLGRLWHDLGSHAGLHHRNRRPGTFTEERISGRREPDPESPNQRQVVVIRCRKSYVGGDRPPARSGKPWKNWRRSRNRIRCWPSCVCYGFLQKSLIFILGSSFTRPLSLCLLQFCQSGVYVRQLFTQVIYALLTGASDAGQQKQNENPQNC